jgi:hypothetical protein
MRRLVVVVAVLTGCDGDHIDVSWSFKNAATGESIPCPEGADIVEVWVSRIEEYLRSSLSGLTDWGTTETARWHATYACSDGEGQTDPLSSPDDAPGEVPFTDFQEGFVVRLQFGDSQTGRIYATSVPEFRFADDLAPAHFEMIDDGGYFSFTWWSTAAIYHPWSICAGSPDELQLNIQGAERVYTEKLRCAGFVLLRDNPHPNTAFTSAYPAGTYDIWLDKLDDGGDVVVMWKKTDVVLLPHNDVHPLL